jgi:hypothetical protein
VCVRVSRTPPSRLSCSLLAAGVKQHAGHSFRHFDGVPYGLPVLLGTPSGTPFLMRSQDAVTDISRHFRLFRTGQASEVFSLLFRSSVRCCLRHGGIRVWTMLGQENFIVNTVPCFPFKILPLIVICKCISGLMLHPPSVSYLARQFS